MNFFKHIFKKLFPLEKTINGGENALANRFLKNLPSFIRPHFEDSHIPRTIKYVTWLGPLLIFPPLSYIVTQNKEEEGADVFVGQAIRYSVGPLVQLGTDAILQSLIKRHLPTWFKSEMQVQLFSFLIAYALYTLVETLGVEKGIQQERKLWQQKATPRTRMEGLNSTISMPLNGFCSQSGTSYFDAKPALALRANASKCVV